MGQFWKLSWWGQEGLQATRGVDCWVGPPSLTQPWSSLLPAPRSPGQPWGLRGDAKRQRGSWGDLGSWGTGLAGALIVLWHGPGTSQSRGAGKGVAPTEKLPRPGLGRSWHVHPLPPTALPPGGTRDHEELRPCGPAAGPHPSPDEPPRNRIPFHQPCGWSQPGSWGEGPGERGPGSRTIGAAVLCPRP